MAIVTLDSQGNRVTLRKGQTLESVVKSVKEEAIAKGNKPSTCIKDIFDTKKKLKDLGSL